VDDQWYENSAGYLLYSEGEIMLDIPKTFTYHTQTSATGLTPDPEEMFRGIGLNRGADCHDE
jgi:hypothetical protein